MDAARWIFASIEPRDVVSWNTLVTGCVVQGHIRDAFQLVGEMQQQGRFTDAATKDSIADMYAKCGCLALSRAVFNQLPWRNVVTWNVLMMAYGMHGLGDEAIVLFDRTVTSELSERGSRG
jgi:pentatricopeptide repeat protein